MRAVIQRVERASVTVAGYLDADTAALAKQGQAMPLWVKAFNLPFPEDKNELTRAELYGLLMMQPEFAGGEEV